MSEEKKAILIQGNEAVGEGAIAAGVRFFAGYPITPATEVAEHLSRRLPQVGGTFIQMEDELASMGAVIGASVGGVKSMTATSGPGVSLMLENISQAVAMEVPCIIVNVQRTGPGTGSITPAQQDVMQAKWGPHGDNEIIAIAPSSVGEVYHLTIKAVNLSERFRVPVIILVDSFIGHLKEKIRLLDPSEVEIYNRKKATGPPEKYRCYEPDETGVPPMADFGSGYRSKIISNMHTYSGGYSRDPEVFDALIRRLQGKILNYLDEVQMTESLMLEDAEVALFAYGTPARAARAAVKTARQRGLKVGLFRAITVWPFPRKEVFQLASRVKRIVVVEMNLGQLFGEVERATAGRAEVISLNSVDGTTITPRSIIGEIEGAV
jgi:2-oxoglutarate ferredoxin oxidoreductase subunit alpha